MIITGLQGLKGNLKPEFSSSSVQNQSICQKNPLDRVTFSGGSLFLTDILSELISVNANDWKKFRKSETKISNSRLLEHPNYGKIKIGYTLEYRPEYSGPHMMGEKVKAFIEIPDEKIVFSTTRTDSKLFELTRKVIGQDIENSLQKKATENIRLTLKRYEKICSELSKVKDNDHEWLC